MMMFSSLVLEGGLLLACQSASRQLSPDTPSSASESPGIWVQREAWTGSCFVPYLEDTTPEQRALNQRLQESAIASG